MEPDEELAKVFRAWWENGTATTSPDFAHYAQEELVSLLEHLHSHGWVIQRRLEADVDPGAS